MSTTLRLLTRLLKAGTLLSTVGFAACVLLQIFARLALPSAPSWTEEAARLIFVLAVGCSAGLALRRDAYVQFDFLFRRLRPPWQWWLALGTQVLTLLLFGLFTVAAVRFAGMGLVERSPSLRFPMAFAFASMVILGGSVVGYALQGLRRHLKRRPR